MRRLLVIGLLVGMIAVSAFAAVNFKNNVQLVDQGVTLLAMGSLTGLGNEDTTILITAPGTPSAICTNKGGNTAPGQNPADVNVSGSVTIDAEEIDHGQLFFSLTSVAPTLTSAQAGCPNSGWTATVTDVAFTEATITVMQGGVVVAQETFSL